MQDQWIMVGIRQREFDALGFEGQFDILDRKGALTPEDDAVFLLPRPALGFNERDPLGQRPIHAWRHA